MKHDSDHLLLSPSDVTAFLACEHLTTLSLAHTRREIDRPEVENEQAELIFRKGLGRRLCGILRGRSRLVISFCLGFDERRLPRPAAEALRP